MENRILRIINCKRGTLPCIYLGIPIDRGLRNSNLWDRSFEDKNRSECQLMEREVDFLGGQIDYASSSYFSSPYLSHVFFSSLCRYKLLYHSEDEEFILAEHKRKAQNFPNFLRKNLQAQILRRIGSSQPSNLG